MLNETTTATVGNNMQTVNKSSKVCAEYNTRNAGAIEAGLMEGWTPSAQVLAEERQAEEYAKREVQLAKSMEEVLRMLDPKLVNFHKYYESASATVCGVRVEVLPIYTKERWSPRQTGWKLEIGSGYGHNANKTWMKIGVDGKLGMDAKQIEKAKAKIAEVYSVEVARKNAQQQKDCAMERTKAFIQANQTFCTRVGHSYYNSGSYYSGMDKRTHYTTKFVVEEDGRITIGSETFTLEQWSAICDLRDKQAAEMKALKDGFKK